MAKQKITKQKANGFIKGSKVLFVMSIIMVTSSLIQAALGYYVVSNVINTVIWLIALVCSVKGW